jgi:hypothetical protein
MARESHLIGEGGDDLVGDGLPGESLRSELGDEVYNLGSVNPHG